MNIQAKLNQANGRLQSGKVGVRIEVRGEHLYLRATFPPKPGSTKQQPSQQRLALGFHANPSGVSAAVNPRSLPTDAQIVAWRDSLPSGSWRWVVGMLACYGLRGHEVFRLDLVDFPVVRGLVGKTGARFIYPLYPE